MLLIQLGRFLLSQVAVLVTSDKTYEVYIDDRSVLMTDEERESLKKQLSELTVYGNMVFLDTGCHIYSSAQKYAEARYRDLCGMEPGVVFLIDMFDREFWLAATRSPKNKLTSATFTEVQHILKGGYLLPIMRILISLFLSLIAALIINLIRLVFSRAIHSKQKNTPALYGTFRKRRSHKEIYKTVKKRYHPDSSGGSGGGSFSGGGGGFSGGGHSF